MENHVLEFDCIGVENGGTFSAEHTGRGLDVSPEFVIKNLSPNAQTIAITLEDLTHPIKNFTHWIIWNIPATDRIKAQIPTGANVPGMSGTRQGIGYGLHKYAGPKPPKGKTHTYRFTVYTLNCKIELSVHSTKRAFLKKPKSIYSKRGVLPAVLKEERPVRTDPGFGTKLLHPKPSQNRAGEAEQAGRLPCP